MNPRLPPGVRAVFFDAVGTLLFPDPPAASVYAAAARRRGVAISEHEIRSRFLAAYREQEAIDREAGWVTSEERERQRWRAIVTASLPGVPDPEGCFHELYAHFARPQAWQLHPEAAMVVAQLRQRGYQVGVGSNYDSRLASVLAGMPDLAVPSENVVISAAVGRRKPSELFFRELVRVAGCRPEQIVFVGDDPENDYAGAFGAGLRPFLLDPHGRHLELDRVWTLAELVGGEPS